MSGFTDAKLARRDEILEAIPEHNGNVYAISQALGFSRTTFYRYREDFPEIAKALAEVREDVGERVEHKLIEQALEGNMTAMIFYLKTQRRWRETNRLEVDAKVQGGVDIGAKREAWSAMLSEWEAEADGADEGDGSDAS